MRLVGGWANGFSPPALFGKAHAMLTCDGSIPGDDLAEKLIERDFGTLTKNGILHAGDHDVHMDIAITSMTKTGHRKATLSLQFLRKINQIHQPAARHNDVLIQLNQTRVSKTITELTTELPESLTGLITERLF